MLRTSAPAAHLGALWGLLGELRAGIPRRYVELLAALRGEHVVAWELFLGAVPERMARDACLRESESVDAARFEELVGFAREVGEKYGVTS